MNNIEHPEENPAVADLEEMDVLHFLFELKREQIDPSTIQSMLFNYRIQNYIKKLREERERTGPNGASPSPALLFNMQTDETLIPEPKVVFNYVPSPKFPTPTTTPEPEPTDDEEPIDYSTNGKKKDDFKTTDRSHLIKLKNEEALKVPPTPAGTPSPSHHDSDSDQENTANNTQLRKLEISPKIENWLGSSIYNNLPELVMPEYDKILRESHKLKVEVVNEMNKEFPVSYDYNPKKSRIRTNYDDPQLADDRTKNNIASRRSRQRKKFQTQMIQYSVDYDEDENFLLNKQEQWLQSIIANLEQKVMRDNEAEGAAKLIQLRKQCGFK